MARLDVYARLQRGHQGYLMNVQAALLDSLSTRTVVLLLPTTAVRTLFKELNPVFDILGEPHVMVTQTIATISAKDLGKPIASLDIHHDQITRALDIH